MASVDDRIVAMQFDNKAFEERVAQTIASLDKLKTSLDFTNAKQKFADLDSAAKGLKLDGIGAAVDGIASKFTAMSAVALSAINAVVTRAISAGVQLGKALSLDLIISGFKEYETNMNSIQTILSNTKADATTLEEVNAALDQLNEYSDQTIYNFGEMARNIGTFTAAGIDLNTSVDAIKGIANLAAISGSNSQQASTAMYQLSQALASGTVKLIDWNSVVNAGMGGEVFQKALFETGKALGTIKDVPIDQTFEEWTDAGNSFRGSLEEGWITSEVLTNTLQGFTGDLTDAQLLAMGYTEAQVAQIQELGQTGKDAATQVKTLTQLLSTVKESIGSGWSQTFRIVFGDFKEATALFTGMNDAIGSFVSAQADARNELLQGWKDLGGRTALIDGLKTGFEALAKVVSTIKDAFRDIFPAMTSERLFELTEGFKALMERLTPSYTTLNNIRDAFGGFFAAISIGIEVLKGVAGVVKTFVKEVTGVGDGGFLEFLGGVGDGLKDLKTALVDGGLITDFFADFSDNLSKFLDGLSFDNVLEKLKELFLNLGEAISSIFNPKSSEGTTALSEAADRLRERFSPLVNLAQRIGDAFGWLIDKIQTIRVYLGKFGDFIKEKFGDIPQAIADVFAKTDYDQALDTVNTGLFAGLVLLVKKFISNGFQFDFGGGFFQNISKTFEQLTGTLQAMQTKLKAEALFKIAAALGLLTISIVTLSLIDSGALTKAMVAISVGFGQLVGALALLDHAISGPGGAAKLVATTTALILLAGAMTLLGLSVKIFSTMSWEELAKGLSSVIVMLGALSGAMKLMSGNTAGMVRAGAGMIGIAIAMNLLAGAVKLFSMMSWAEMSKGLVGVAGGLAAIVAAVNLMPSNMVSKGVGLVAIAFALNLLAGAVKLFSLMDWKELGKGMAAVAASLLVIAGAMHLMPNGAMMVLQGAGLVLIGVALLAIAKAVKSFSEMSWKEIGKGLATLAGSLIILGVAATAMSGSIIGAAAISIMSVALLALAKALQEFSELSWGELLKGLVGIAATLGVLAAAAALITPTLPSLLALGVALALIGAGFALFGLGANLVATAFSIIATAGTQGIATLSSALDVLIQHLPAALEALGEGIIALATKLLEALPGLVSQMGATIGALLQVIIDNIPKMGELFVELIMTGLAALKETVPEVIAAGLELLISFLKGIRDNIAEITTTVGEIIVEFLTALANKTQEIVTAGLQVLTEFLKGIADNIGDVTAAVGDIVAEFVKGIGDNAIKFITAGTEVMVKLVKGIGNGITSVARAATDAVVAFIDAIGDMFLDLIRAGWELILKVLNGIADSIEYYFPQIRAAGIRIAVAIIDGMTFGLASKAGELLQTAKDLAGKVLGALGGLAGFALGSPSKKTTVMGEQVAEGLAIGMDKDKTAERSAEDLSNRVTDAMQNALNAANAELNDLVGASPTITPVIDLTQAIAAATRLNALLQQANVMSVSLSANNANIIAASSRDTIEANAAANAQTKTTEIKFEQNIHSPEALSTADIYRQTRNQIALAKEELAVL